MAIISLLKPLRITSRRPKGVSKEAWRMEKLSDKIAAVPNLDCCMPVRPRPASAPPPSAYTAQTRKKKRGSLRMWLKPRHKKDCPTTVDEDSDDEEQLPPTPTSPFIQWLVQPDPYAPPPVGSPTRQTQVKLLHDQMDNFRIRVPLECNIPPAPTSQKPTLQSRWLATKQAMKKKLAATAARVRHSRSASTASQA